jgi:S1-C subfamily serine protease
MASEQKKTQDNDENLAAYGGYSTRHQYEKSREKKKKAWFGSAAVGVIAILLIPAIIGFISLSKGEYFPQESSGEGGETVRVPTGIQLNENAKDPEQMIRELDVSLVTVSAETESGVLRYGSGFVISEEGHLLCSTTLFAQEPLHSLKVQIDGISYSAKKIGAQEELGFAVLQVESLYGLIPVSAGNFVSVGRGETLYAVAAVGGDFYGTALSGMVASVGKTVSVGEGDKAFQVPLAYLDMKPNESVYGAPVVDAGGSLVGVCTHAYPSPYGDLATVVPVHVVYTLVNQILGN